MAVPIDLRHRPKGPDEEAVLRRDDGLRQAAQKGRVTQPSFFPCPGEKENRGTIFRKLSRMSSNRREGRASSSPPSKMRHGSGLCQPWRQARPYWDHCAGEILKAAETRRRADIVEATRCLEVALRRDNWL
jgi:hypothetical protein